MATSWRNIAFRIVSFLVAGLFIYTGAIKALDPIRFANDISNYVILPWPIGVRLAFYLPWLEIFCSLAVILGVLRRGALAILTALLLVFIAAAIAAKARGIDITCGCFGHAGKNLSFVQHLGIDLLLFCALVFLWFSNRQFLYAER
jgi:putative oxidoreductase